MTRKETLETAVKCVCGDRDQQYGTPEDNFITIANLWTDYLTARGASAKIEAVDVAAMMCLFKVARIATGTQKADSWVDIAGYSACGAEIATKGEGQ